MIAAKPDKTSFLERVDLEELVHRFMEQFDHDPQKDPVAWRKK